MSFQVVLIRYILHMFTWFNNIHYRFVATIRIVFRTEFISDLLLQGRRQHNVQNAQLRRQRVKQGKAKPRRL